MAGFQKNIQLSLPVRIPSVMSIIRLTRADSRQRHSINTIADDHRVIQKIDHMVGGTRWQTSGATTLADPPLESQFNQPNPDRRDCSLAYKGGECEQLITKCLPMEHDLTYHTDSFAPMPTLHFMPISDCEWSFLFIYIHVLCK